MEIRPAVPADAAQMARMRYDFRIANGPTTEPREQFIGRCTRWMEARLGGSEAWRCWVAESPAGITGQLWLQLIEKVPNPSTELESHAYITNVYVEPAARGDGTGHQLLEAALGYCRAAGVDSVILWPTSRSRTLYARHGFAVRDDIMEAILDSGRHLP